MVIWIKFPHSHPNFSSLIPKMLMLTFVISHLTTSNFPWFMDVTFQVPMQYYFFTALDFTFTTRHIHNRVLFLLWPSLFILSGAISNCPPFFPSRILDTFWPGKFDFWYHVFLPFFTVHVVLVLIIPRDLPFPPASSGPQSTVLYLQSIPKQFYDSFFLCHIIWLAWSASWPGTGHLQWQCGVDREFPLL